MGEDKIAIGTFVIVKDTDSVQEVVDIEIIDGERVFYTRGGNTYKLEHLEVEPDEDDFEYMTSSEIKEKLLTNIFLN